MFWADRFAEEIERRFGKSGNLIVRDEKTASGRVHVGSMRGVAIHGTVAEALADRGVQNTYLYEINDYDPMDDIPVYLPREFKSYLGKTLRDVPSPDGKAENFAEYFANEFTEIIEKTGWHPQFYRSSELYLSGKMDNVIREALSGAEAIRRIYHEVSGSQREEEWLPLSVLCPQCGKQSTTEASDFQGDTVHVHCRPDKVDWTTGCGFEGRVSPFGGKAKLPWKVEWPAKWKVMNVSVEGGGKDHSTKGGARDVANHIAKEVFKYEPPFDLPYEFFLVGGKKMASSKGRGSSAKEISELIPPKIFRLALLSKEVSHAFNFDPEGDTIPMLYDLFDKFAEHYNSGVQDDYARLFTLLYPKEERKRIQLPFLPRFSHIAFVVQMPHMNLEKEVETLKGSPMTDLDRMELQERAEYAKRWLEKYAPEKYVFKLQETLPEEARNLNEEQKKVLSKIAEYVEKEEDASGEALHKFLHGLKEESSLPPAELFGALYLVFLGKPSGPKAGWFLSSISRDFLISRIREATD